MIIVKIIILLVFLTVINITDTKGYKIKNKTVLPVLIIGIILGIINRTFADSIFGMLIPLVLFPLYALRMLGAGDIKALCAIGAVMGFSDSVITMLLTFVSGCIIAIGFMLVRTNFIERIKYFFAYLKVCITSRSVQKYNFGGNEKSYFRFSYAITAGTVLMIINYYTNFLAL